MIMRVASAVVVLVALVCIAVGWLQSPDDISRADAVTVATHSFRAAGVPGARVDQHPTAGLYEPPAGGPKVPVWKTSAAYKGGTIKLWLTRSDAESVFLDDRTPDGASQLLTDTQFKKLADHYENPAVARKIRRNLLLTVAAALVALLAVRIAVETARSGWRPPRRGDAEDDPAEAAGVLADLDEWIVERDWTPRPFDEPTSTGVGRLRAPRASP